MKQGNTVLQKLLFVIILAFLLTNLGSCPRIIILAEIGRWGIDRMVERVVVRGSHITLFLINMVDGRQTALIH